MHRNPAAEADLPARPPSRRTALDATQLKDLHLVLVAHSRDPDLDDLVFQFLRETACRRGGLISLSTVDIAPHSAMARLNEKYDKERWLPLSAHLTARLLDHREARHPGCRRVLHRADGGHLTDRWFDGFGRRLQRLDWAVELGISAHWVRHTTLTDIERIAGLRLAGAYAGHSDSAFGVTGRYTKASPEELRLAHTRLFFPNPKDTTDPSVAPNLFRRALPTALRAVEFTAA